MENATQIITEDDCSDLLPPQPKKTRRKKRHAEHGEGQVFRHGNSWHFRFRDWRMVCDECGKEQAKHKNNGHSFHGQPQWVRVCEKLCDVAQGFRGTVPPTEVNQQANERLATVKASKKTPQAVQLLAEYAESAYLPYIEKRVRPSTSVGYKARWNQLKPWIEAANDGKGLRLRDTGTSDIEDLFDTIAAKTKLNRNSIRSLRNLLAGIFRRAISDKGVMPKGAANPVREAKMPNSRSGEETYAYSLAEIDSMLVVLPEPARTAVAVAAFTGLRRGEIRGVLWESYDGQQITVSQSVWGKCTTDPKTEKSKAPVPVIGRLARILEMHRLRAGNPASGPVFRNDVVTLKSGKTKGGQAEDMNNLLNRQILPALNRCGQCRKSADEHTMSDHKYERDASLPRWHGWHAFRRGLATNLHDLGVDDITIQMILRHQDVNTTRRCYIKGLPQQATDAMNRFEQAMSATVQ